MELGACDRCKRKGRAQNLSLINNKFLCPTCCDKEPIDKSRYHFMLFRERQGKKVIQLMDFKTGGLLVIHDDVYLKRELAEDILKAIDSVWECKILSRSHYHSSK